MNLVVVVVDASEAPAAPVDALEAPARDKKFILIHTLVPGDCDRYSEAVAGCFFGIFLILRKSINTKQ